MSSSRKTARIWTFAWRLSAAPYYELKTMGGSRASGDFLLFL